MYRDGKFENDPPVPMILPGRYMEMIRRELFGSEQRVPPYPLRTVHPNRDGFHSPVDPGLRAIWFGHATVLVELDGLRFFSDPILSDRASPFSSLGPERFFQPPLSLEELPPVDAVVISHDHYDHLDMNTVTFLARRGTIFFVPLGVGAHLESWGIAASQIVEMDWWESRSLGAVKIHCTPAVHYSGRSLTNGNQTLWSSWSIIGPSHRFFHSGDSGFSEHFAEIGKRLGPFDMTSIKIGAYDVTWEGIHMSPEHAVDAHVALRGRIMLPVHWGTFNLAVHDWDEPILRAREAAKNRHVNLVTPGPGEIVDADKSFVSTEWWKNQ